MGVAGSLGRTRGRWGVSICLAVALHCSLVVWAALVYHAANGPWRSDTPLLRVRLFTPAPEPTDTSVPRTARHKGRQALPDPVPVRPHRKASAAPVVRKRAASPVTNPAAPGRRAPLGKKPAPKAAKAALSGSTGIVTPSSKAQMRSSRASASSNEGTASASSGARLLSGYLVSLKATLERRKRYPERARLLGHQGLVRLVFTVGKRGELMDAKIQRGSGWRELDRAALRTLRRSAPLPPPPEAASPPLRLAVSLEFRLAGQTQNSSFSHR